MAQFGSAHGLGPWGRRFKSFHPDHLKTVIDSGVWRSLVARMLREHEVEGSNPFTPTKEICPVRADFFMPFFI